VRDLREGRIAERECPDFTPLEMYDIDAVGAIEGTGRWQRVLKTVAPYCHVLLLVYKDVLRGGAGV
jgi:hypothetical protein